MDKVNVCIVGLGWTGSNHYAGYAALREKATIVAVVARSEAAQAKARAWGILKIYTSYEDALKDSEIDAFSICTPRTNPQSSFFGCHPSGFPSPRSGATICAPPLSSPSFAILATHSTSPSSTSSP